MVIKIMGNKLINLSTYKADVLILTHYKIDRQ
jgi:hypothetical protein